MRDPRDRTRRNPPETVSVALPVKQNRLPSPYKDLRMSVTTNYPGNSLTVSPCEMRSIKHEAARQALPTKKEFKTTGHKP